MDQKKAGQLAQDFRSSTMTGIESEGGDSVIEPLPFKSSSENNVAKSTQQETKSNTNQNVSRAELEKTLEKNELANLEKLKEEITNENKDMSSYMTLSIDNRGLVISLKNAAFFDSGSENILPENKGALSRVAKILKKINNYIRIEGHTDNIPIHTEKFYSNWELSSARASSVVRFLISNCDISPNKVVAVGYGENKPIADNSTSEGRAKNRRIDIIVLSEKYDNLEKHTNQ